MKKFWFFLGILVVWGINPAIYAQESEYGYSDFQTPSSLGNSWGSYYDKFNYQTINPYYGSNQNTTSYQNTAFDSSKTVSLLDFLNSQCFGKEVQFTDNEGNIVGNGITKEFIIREDGYSFILENGQRLKVVFETGGSKTPSLPTYANPSQSQAEIMQKRLQLEQMLSTTIAGINSSDSVSNTTAQTNSSLSTLTNQPNYFTPSGRIRYYDKMQKQEKINEIMINNDTIYLDDGSPITYRLER